MKTTNKLNWLLLAAAITLVSCTNGAKISGTLKDVPAGDVTVRLLDINKYETLDTIKTKANGSFIYKIGIEKNQPEFVYLFYKDTKIASLILSKGEKAVVEADSLGKYTVSGSPESEKLLDVERSYAEFLKKADILAGSLESVPEASADAAEIKSELTKLYVNYYRSILKYIITNPYSMSVVPVFYQNFGDMPVLSRQTDAILFCSICDSLETVYPDSKYVKALRNEATKRKQLFDLNSILDKAGEVGFPDIELPDMNGKDVKLSEVDAKMVMVMFWLASEADQKMFNLDFVKKIYDEYHSRGLQVYQVSLDADKTQWAQVMKNQKLPWINVCDSRSSDSPYLSLYNLQEIPSIFLISGGEFVPDQVKNEAELRKVIEKYLK